MQWCLNNNIQNHHHHHQQQQLLLIKLLLFYFRFTFSLQEQKSSIMYYDETKSSYSICSPELFYNGTDVRTKNDYVQPCPVAEPCRCLCEVDTKRLWIDCFYKKLKSLPIPTNWNHLTDTTIVTNRTNNGTTQFISSRPILWWNIDLSFNLFSVIDTKFWSSIYIKHFVLSRSLSFDIIRHLNMTHRNLIDLWPNNQIFNLTDDEYRDINGDNDDDDDEKDGDDIENDQHYYPSRLKRFLTITEHNKMLQLLNNLNEQLNLNSKRVEKFEMKLLDYNITSLYLDHNNLTEIPIDSLENATRIQEIYLSYNNIKKIPSYAFGFSHRLTRIDLSHNLISNISLDAFQRHPDAFGGPFLIDYLDLSYNNLTILDEPLFSYLVNLRIFKLQHNNIIILTPKAWTGLYRLKYLDLSHNQLDNLTTIFYSSYLNELRQLKLTSNNITTFVGCEFLTLKALTKLNLNGNNLSDINLCTFYGLNQNSNLNRYSQSSSLHLQLKSNQFKTFNPCIFNNFSRSTIEIDNNPLVCNCTFNYLLNERKSIIYTGTQCRGGYQYGQNQQQMPAIRKNSIIEKSSLSSKKSFLNESYTSQESKHACREQYAYYNQECKKLNCFQICLQNEQYVLQVSTVSTPSRANSQLKQNFVIIYVISFYFYFYRT
ncbi:unnamed protein product [Didymodactylos carnosus]|uniref:Uncharacterized protein n=1 Tax=Didymodactylos carnosus TaxID=1234261 RepID=A0A813PIM4_9BILA|nr:unnamed protein product [Didymodactylos carnosus]CAF0910415.1 unnamed protein product [Didymodactylos carnosus]CAF3533399.1 unnamed protein product [Didymodactylos carnosus]CAF3689522.1 unnamed protein product [Didymodactylos carnosus]